MRFHIIFALFLAVLGLTSCTGDSTGATTGGQPALDPSGVFRGAALVNGIGRDVFLQISPAGGGYTVEEGVLRDDFGAESAALSASVNARALSLSSKDAAKGTLTASADGGQLQGKLPTPDGIVDVSLT
jgi:hypothetical protein